MTKIEKAEANRAHRDHAFTPREGALRYQAEDGGKIAANPGDPLFSTVAMVAEEVFTAAGWEKIEQPPAGTNLDTVAIETSGKLAVDYFDGSQEQKTTYIASTIISQAEAEKLLEARVTALEKALLIHACYLGRPGTGACICRASPESIEADAARMLETWETNSKSRFPRNAFLDHRCPHHGEKAQPALWGRHKEKELETTFKQWDSLGVKKRLAG